MNNFFKYFFWKKLKWNILEIYCSCSYSFVWSVPGNCFQRSVWFGVLRSGDSFVWRLRDFLPKALNLQVIPAKSFTIHPTSEINTIQHNSFPHDETVSVIRSCFDVCPNQRALKVPASRITRKSTNWRILSTTWSTSYDSKISRLDLFRCSSVSVSVARWQDIFQLPQLLCLHGIFSLFLRNKRALIHRCNERGNYSTFRLVFFHDGHAHRLRCNL